MLTDLGERIELNTDHVNKDLENIKMTESKINDAMSEIFKTLEGMNSRLSNTEECVSDLEVRIMEFTQTEQQTHEKILTVTYYQGNANQNHSEISPNTYQNDYHQKDNEKQALTRLGRKGNPCILLAEI